MDVRVSLEVEFFNGDSSIHPQPLAASFILLQSKSTNRKTEKVKQEFDYVQQKKHHVNVRGTFVEMPGDHAWKRSSAKGISLG